MSGDIITGDLFVVLVDLGFCWLLRWCIYKNWFPPRACYCFITRSAWGLILILCDYLFSNGADLMNFSMLIRSDCIFYYEYSFCAYVTNGCLLIRVVDRTRLLYVICRVTYRRNGAPDAAFTYDLRSESEKISNYYGGTLACALNLRRATVANSTVCLRLLILRRCVIAGLRCNC